MKKNIILILGSLIISLLIIEIFFRLFYPVNMQSYYGEIIDPNKKFVSLKKNHHHKIDRWNYKYFASYNLGEFHNRITRKVNKDKDKILILGDSFTFGLYLKDKDTYIDKLQNKFDNFYLVNSSTPGWSLEDYYLFSKNFCNIIRPKEIIIILNDGDLGRIREKAIISNSKSLKERYKLYKILIENFMTMAFLRDNLYKIFNSLNKVSKKDFEGTALTFDLNITIDIVEDAKKIFLDLKKTSDLCNSSLHIINLGWTKKKNYNQSLKDPKEYLLQNNKEFFPKNLINFYDNTPFLKYVHNNKIEFIIKNEGHPNEKGAQKIFESLSIHFEKILN